MPSSRPEVNVEVNLSRCAMTVTKLPETWRRAIEQWAVQNGNIKEVWLFGSRARGEATDDKDVDIAITLMPLQGSHDWALGDYQCSETTGRENSLG
jgi:predicted nucleotidyltransferase